MVQPIYLDYNGTTPHDPEVIAAMRPFLETEFGNPSSSHWYGIRPKAGRRGGPAAGGRFAGLPCRKRCSSPPAELNPTITPLRVWPGL